MSDQINYTQPEEHIRPDVRLAGSITGLNPFYLNNSASRQAMDASHVAQAVVLKEPDIMSVSSGMDYNYAEHVIDVRFEGEPDEDVKVLKIIKKYTRTGGDTSVETCPETYVIYENLSTNVIGVAILPKYRFNHMLFGYDYIPTEVCQRLREGDIYPAGTVLLTTPGVNQTSGTYCYGKVGITAMGSFKEVIEDGIGISESFAQKLTSRKYGEMVVNYGKEAYLLNLYGDENNYKPFPDIGEKIRDDGLLFALRDLDEELSPVQMTPKALMTIDYGFDQLHYAEPGATVLDITVQHSHNPSMYHSPTDMNQQPHRYWVNHTNTMEALRKYHRELRRIKGDGLILSPRLHRLITMAYQQDHEVLKNSVQVTYRKEQIQEYRVTIAYGKDFPMTMGSKLCTLAADKGVITAIIPDDKMPLDGYGRRADVLVDASSSVHRMNSGRLWEGELAESLEQQRAFVRELLEAKGWEAAYDYLLGYYQIMFRSYYEIISKGLDDKESQEYHVHQFIEHEISPILPIGSDFTGSEMSLRLQEHFPLKYGKVTLYDPKGNPVESKNDICFIPMYYMRLEKVGSNWASTSVPKRQQHGIISKLSATTKDSLPYRAQSIRIAGETEVRLLMAAANPAYVASLLQLANNNVMCNDAVLTILRAENPAVIPELIDYSKLPYYKSRALERIEHFLYCYGLKLEYVDERQHTFDKISNVNIDEVDYSFGDTE